MIFFYLETPRLMLRQFTPEVYQHVFTHYSEDEIAGFFNFRNSQQLAEERIRFEKGLVTYRTSFVNFHLLEKESGINMGACGFHTWYLEHNRAELGYAITIEAFKNRGFMSEAAKKIMDFGFTEMKLHRIEALVAPDNNPSLKLIKNLGFVPEGNLREHYKKDGVLTDSLVFGILKREFEAMRSGF